MYRAPNCEKETRPREPSSEPGSNQTQEHIKKGELFIATKEVHVLLCRTSVLSKGDVCDLLTEARAAERTEIESRVYTATVPLVPPMSSEQSSLYSKQYWPTIYKKHNPFGPQHNIITEAEIEIGGNADYYMTLAASLGAATFRTGLGRSIGAVVIDRRLEKDGILVAAAGDARWYGRIEEKGNAIENPMAHATMRAIGMVAQKRRDKHVEQLMSSPDGTAGSLFADFPITLDEHKLSSQSAVDDVGYVCLDLEIYITHEPCVMCCMALLHSRFGRIVFGTRMTATGGLLAEREDHAAVPDLRYGLFWLPSLNWKLLAWQWIAEKEVVSQTIGEAWHA